MPNPKYRERGQRLKEARQLAGISQEELSQATGIKQSNISRYERGMYDIPAEIIVYLFEKFGTNPAFILLGKFPISLKELARKKEKT